jgi:putative transposase
MLIDQIRRWHHAPAHIFIPGATYMVTASTLYQEHLFNTPEKRDMLHESLLRETSELGWQLQSWAVLINHYHFVGLAPEHGADLKTLIRHLHSKTAIALNRLDSCAGRQVWFQYWDTCLTFEKSYLARLKYVYYNPVHHKLVAEAENYPYCSAAWFARTADPCFYRKVESFRCDKLNVKDDF